MATKSGVRVVVSLGIFLALLGQSGLGRAGDAKERGGHPPGAAKPSAERARLQSFPNLTLVKEKLIAYHDCHCDCGCYTDDLNRIGQRALAYLRHYLAARKKDSGGAQAGLKPAVVLDIDETAISNWENLRKQDFGYSHEEFIEWENEARATAIQPVLALYQLAGASAVATFFITGRSETERAATAKDLERAGYTAWTGLIMRQPGSPKLARDFKSAERKKLRQAGYVIVINVGDQESDLAGEPALRSVKLPNPFYYVR